MSIKVLSFDPAIKNIGWSICEMKDGEFKILKFGLLDISENKKCTNSLCKKPAFYYSMDSLEMHITCCKGHKEEFGNLRVLPKKTTQQYCKDLIDKLIMFDNEDFSTVIIENQPSLKNPIVKSIQCMIMTYFIKDNKKVILQNPTCKMFGMKFDKNKYKQNKLFSIKILKEIADEQIMKKISMSGKIDDIADAVGHSLYFLNNGKRPKVLDTLFK